jgi:surfeit locus 1 family protein
VTLRSFIVLLAAVAGALATARLGLWQLDRAAQKTALHEALLARGALPALDRAQLASTPESAVEQQHRQVVLEGRWLASHRSTSTTGR